MSRSFSFASKVSRLVLGVDDDDGINDLLSPSLFSAQSSSPVINPTLPQSLFSASTSSIQFSTPKADSSTSLFSSPLDSTIRPNLDLSLSHPHSRPLDDGPILEDDGGNLPSPPLPILFSSQDDSSPPPPNFSSTPIATEPNTQQLAFKMIKLRSVDEIDAVALKRENEALRSEMTALRLQLEEQKLEIVRLRAEQQRPPNTPPPNTPPPLDSSEGYSPYTSKKKKKKIRKKERETAETTLPPGCTSLPSGQAPTPPPLLSEQPQQQQLRQKQQQLISPKLYIFHDSNLKNVTAAEINKYINNNNNNNSKKYNIEPHETFTLPQTLRKIQQTNFKPNDAVIINVLTNDARQTQKRNQRSPYQTRRLQTEIIQHLLQHIPRQNITILESPPLLDSPSSDIYHYNHASVLLARQLKIRFADTLVGEQHIWKDGYHLLRSSRHLLVKSVAAAAAHFSPHQRFGLSRPPFGEYGPWAAPKDQGVFPREYRQMAVAQPMSFRRQRRTIMPLMGINIQRPQ